MLVFGGVPGHLWSVKVGGFPDGPSGVDIDSCRCLDVWDDAERTKITTVESQKLENEDVMCHLEVDGGRFFGFFGC